MGPLKTARAKRTVALPTEAVEALRKHLERFEVMDPDQLVFVGPRGACLRRSGFNQSWWQPAIKMAGFQGLRFHDLRHTFVSLWIEMGRNPLEISRDAGHSSVAFTMTQYGHLFPRDWKKEQSQLDAYLNGMDGEDGVAESQRAS